MCGLMLTAVSPGGIGKFHKTNGITWPGGEEIRSKFMNCRCTFYVHTMLHGHMLHRHTSLVCCRICSLDLFGSSAMQVFLPGQTLLEEGSRVQLKKCYGTLCCFGMM